MAFEDPFILKPTVAFFHDINGSPIKGTPQKKSTTDEFQDLCSPGSTGVATCGVNGCTCSSLMDMSCTAAISQTGNLCASVQQPLCRHVNSDGPVSGAHIPMLLAVSWQKLRAVEFVHQNSSKLDLIYKDFGSSLFGVLLKKHGPTSKLSMASRRILGTDRGQPQAFVMSGLGCLLGLLWLVNMRLENNQFCTFDPGRTGSPF